MRSSSTFMRMIFSKLRNATMTAQSKLCPFVAVTITDEILYNNSCAICDIAGFKPSSIAIRTDVQRNCYPLMRKVMLKKSNVLVNRVPSITLTMW